MGIVLLAWKVCLDYASVEKSFSLTNFATNQPLIVASLAGSSSRAGINAPRCATRQANVSTRWKSSCIMAAESAASRSSLSADTSAWLLAILTSRAQIFPVRLKCGSTVHVAKSGSKSSARVTQTGLRLSATRVAGKSSAKPASQALSATARTLLPTRAPSGSNTIQRSRSSGLRTTFSG